jgi:hypothetical protein
MLPTEIVAFVYQISDVFAFSCLPPRAWRSSSA